MAETIITEKYCSKCEQTLPFKDFHANRTKKYGLALYCRECSKDRSPRPPAYEPDLPNEVWKECVQSSDYAVSNMGRVKRITFGKSVRPKRILTPVLTTFGYHEVALGVGNRFPVHQLICRAFHGEPPTARHEPDHQDFDRTNNRADNLKWATRKENLNRSKEAGRDNSGSRNGQAKLVDADVLLIIHLLKTTQRTHTDIGGQFNVGDGCVQQINVGRTWKSLLVGETFPLQKRG